MDSGTSRAGRRIAASEAGARILELYEAGCGVSEKPDLSPVTEADLAAEAIILEALSRRAPGVPVVAEESCAAGRVPAVERRFFLVDPLDGTKDFVARGRDFTVNIALIEGGAPRLGIVQVPIEPLLSDKPVPPIRFRTETWWQSGGIGTSPMRETDSRRLLPVKTPPAAS